MLRRLVVLVFAAAVLVLPARALVFNVTYDSTVTSQPNAAQIEAAFAVATLMFQNQFTNQITVNLAVWFTNVNLGANVSQLVGSTGFGYANLVTALRNARTSAADINAVASLPVSDPTGGGQMWWIPRAEAKVLNLTSLGVSPNDAVNDGVVMFATPDTSTIYAFDSTNRAVAGEWDFIGVAEHEISEVLGRTYRLNLGGGYLPYDLFRFTNSGARCFDPYATGVYFSVDDGGTQVEQFYPDVTTGDVQDWASNDPSDVFDAYVNSGEQLQLSPADLTALDILGYTVAWIPSPRLTGVALAGGDVRFSFTNTPAVSYTVLASTNLTAPLTSWTVLGNPVEYPAGHFQFTDTPPGGSPQRFYRVRSP